jgi:hypothetical protein
MFTDSNDYLPRNVMFTDSNNYKQRLALLWLDQVWIPAYNWLPSFGHLWYVFQLTSDCPLMGLCLPVIALFWASDRCGMCRVLSGLICTLRPSSFGARLSSVSPAVSRVSLLPDFFTCWPSSADKKLMLELEPWDRPSDRTSDWDWRALLRSWFSIVCSFCNHISIQIKISEILF